jgi:kelch-like protein 26
MASALVGLNLNGQCYESHSHNQLLLNGLNDLRKKGHLFDVTLKAGEREFQAHRAVLASVSDYFRAMFTCDTLEANQRAISMINVPATGIELLLDYIYTSRLLLNLENIQVVLAAASYVQLESVICHCRSYLQTQLDVENCIDTLIISETYSLHRLKEKVYRYICAHLYEVSKTPDFIRLTSAQLQNILSCDYPVDCSELNVLKIAIGWILKTKTDNLTEQQQILQHIRYQYTPLADLEVILGQLHICASSDIYQFVVQSARHKIHNVATSNTANPLTYQNSLLINFRGMELAVIKIGGFDLSGITNEITYCFPEFETKKETKTWKHLTSIPHIKQSNFGTVVLNNQLYVIGGCYDISLQEYIHPFGFRYCPIANKWQTISPMHQDRCRFSLNVVKGALYAVGGVSEVDDDVAHQNDANSSSCEKYNAALDKWEYIQALPEYRTQHAGASLGSCLYVCGGLDAYGQVLETFYRYNTTYGAWTKMPDMLGRRTDHILLTLGNKLYVCGGWYEINSTRVLCNTIEGE